MRDLWIPGVAGAQPSLDEFVERVHRRIERYTATHAAEKSEVEVELADGERLTLQSLSPEPGYGFVTLTVHPAGDEDPREVIVPVGSIRRIALGPAAAERARFGFSLPEPPTPQTKETEPAA
jgi:hypothetical protein